MQRFAIQGGAERNTELLQHSSECMIRSNQKEGQGLGENAENNL